MSQRVRPAAHVLPVEPAERVVAGGAHAVGPGEPGFRRKLREEGCRSGRRCGGCLTPEWVSLGSRLSSAAAPLGPACAIAGNKDLRTHRQVEEALVAGKSV